MQIGGIIRVQAGPEGLQAFLCLFHLSLRDEFADPRTADDFPAPDLFRDHDSPEVVDSSDNSSRFHDSISFFGKGCFSALLLCRDGRFFMRRRDWGFLTAETFRRKHFLNYIENNEKNIPEPIDKSAGILYNTI